MVIPPAQSLQFVETFLGTKRDPSHVKGLLAKGVLPG